MNTQSITTDQQFESFKAKILEKFGNVEMVESIAVHAKAFYELARNTLATNKISLENRDIQHFLKHQLPELGKDAEKTLAEIYCNVYNYNYSYSYRTQREKNTLDRILNEEGFSILKNYAASKIFLKSLKIATPISCIVGFIFHVVMNSSTIYDVTFSILALFIAEVFLIGFLSWALNSIKNLRVEDRNFV